LSYQAMSRYPHSFLSCLVGTNTPQNLQRRQT
jgi:hypothetical protein